MYRFVYQVLYFEVFLLKFSCAFSLSISLFLSLSLQHTLPLLLILMSFLNGQDTNKCSEEIKLHSKVPYYYYLKLSERNFLY